MIIIIAQNLCFLWHDTVYPNDYYYGAKFVFIGMIWHTLMFIIMA